MDELLNCEDPEYFGITTGRMSALRIADGGVRGTVVGDTTRRLVARTTLNRLAIL